MVAQGWEAVGHRGIFTADAEDEALPLLALVRALSKDVSIPIVAAGGLMNGGDIAKVIAAGATAAQLGTAFCAPTRRARLPHIVKYSVMLPQRRFLPRLSQVVPLGGFATRLSRPWRASRCCLFRSRIR